MPRLAVLPIVYSVAVLSGFPYGSQASEPAGPSSASPTILAETMEMAAKIDQLIEARLDEAGWQPAPQCSDEVFLRRVSLDLTGVLPTVSEARSFLKDDRPDKRSRLVERLLQSPAHPTHMASMWRNIMLPRGFDRAQLNNAAGLQNWLRNQFVKNLRYDNLVAEFLVATGDGTSGPALYYTSLELAPDKLAASSARIFLGLQIQCAQCHDHPDEDWSQRDFWGYAAFFSQLPRPDGMLNADVVDLPSGEVTLPDTEEVVAPQFPDGTALPADALGSRRAQLAIWMASRDNPYLPRAAVNTTWAQLFGRGIVNPVDDMGNNNPPSHPELLDELTAYFTRNQFDLRLLIRTLVLTRAYQRSSQLPAVKARSGNAPEGDEGPVASATGPIPAELFGRMLVKSLNSEQLYDCVTRAAGTESLPSDGDGGPLGPLVNRRDPFLAPRRLNFVSRMHRQTRDATQYQAGLPHALLLMNGPEIQAATSPAQSRLLRGLQAPWFTNEQRVETLFLATLTRFPTGAERQAVVDMLQKSGDTQQVLADTLWALLNSAEFSLNH